jgi:hypothetical protein
MNTEDKKIKNDSKQKNINIEIKINDENKNILYMLANTAQCYAKLSYKSHKYYDKIQSWLTIPVIFFSTIIGTASFTNISNASADYYIYLSIIIGSINILISIFTTILRYFKISEYNEMYRVSHIAWDGFVRDILLIMPNIKDEDSFKIYFNKKLSEYSTLMDNTPIFPIRIINKFKKYTKQIENEYFKPSQINKEIISIEAYIEKFKDKSKQLISNKDNIQGINIDNYIENNKKNKNINIQSESKSESESESDIESKSKSKSKSNSYLDYDKLKDCCTKISYIFRKNTNIDDIQL